MTAARVIVPGKVYALGGSVPLDGRVSWAPATAGLSQPCSCYLLTEGDSALLVDTGVPAHWPAMETQLRALVEPGTSVKVFLTRPELDCAANLPAIREIYRLEDTDVLSGGADTPFDFFNEAAALNQPTQGYSHVVLRTSGFDLGNERRVRIVVPKLRFLPTYWPFDVSTGTLFTSDLFTHVCESTDGSPVLDDLASHLLCKFWWLSGAVTQPFVDDLRSIFTQLQPEILAPDHGGVIRGRAAVDEQLDALTDVLAACAAGKAVA
ncbi:MAG TPA: hypothetical protein VGG41_11615 [Solirubrobacteraceae bacterium]|jgi:flavorubredoxin